MKLYNFCLLTTILFTGFINSISAQTRQPPPRPNMIVIFMDDMGYGDPECYAGTPYKTPAINKLAAEGMRFTNFYAAQAVCSASRAGLLTGCYPNRIGIHGALMPWATLALNPEEETIASTLKKAGYHTGMIGKWHLGAKAPYLPVHYGFDEYLGLPYSNDMWPVGYDGRPVTDTADRKFKYPPLPLLEGDLPVRFIKTLEDQGTLTATYTERACDFIKRNKKIRSSYTWHILWCTCPLQHHPVFWERAAPGYLAM